MNRPVLGIIGAGRVGTAMARQALKAGYTVYISNSRGPASLSLLVEVLIPGAIAVTAAEAALYADIVYLAVPLSKYRSIPVAQMSGKIVIDAMNYWPQVEGNLPEFADNPRQTSEVIQEFLPNSRVVKTLNHIGYHELEEESLPAGTPTRRSLALAGNDRAAKTIVAQLISDLGFDTFDAGPLVEGWRFGPGTPVFNGRYTAVDIKKTLQNPHRVPSVSETAVAAR